MTTITAPLLQLIKESGEAVLTLTEDLPQQELLRSRLTRVEVQRQLQCLLGVLDAAAPLLRERMPELDWAGWHAAGQALAAPGPAQDEALCFAVQSLVPATLSWLRVYKQEQPALFEAWG